MFLVLNGCKAHSAISYALYKNQLLLLLLLQVHCAEISFRVVNWKNLLESPGPCLYLIASSCVRIGLKDGQFMCLFNHIDKLLCDSSYVKTIDMVF